MRNDYNLFSYRSSKEEIIILFVCSSIMADHRLLYLKCGYLHSRQQIRSFLVGAHNEWYQNCWKSAWWNNAEPAKRHSVTELPFRIIFFTWKFIGHLHQFGMQSLDHLGDILNNGKIITKASFEGSLQLFVKGIIDAIYGSNFFPPTDFFEFQQFFAYIHYPLNGM